MNETVETVRELAWEVRRELETRVPLTRGQRRRNEAGHVSLKGLCGLASDRVWRRLGKNSAVHFGYFLTTRRARGAVIPHAAGHAWVVWQDAHRRPWIVDVTATQFGAFPRVLIARPFYRYIAGEPVTT